MKLIRPSEISAKILTLLDESDERVIIVSPYIRISKWYKLMRKINELKTRKILAEIYVRDDPENQATYHDLDQLKLQYVKIPYLHSKLYMNERYGIVTSMNLLLSSEINSLEIGYITETSSEYKDLLRYYQRYICSGEPIHSDAIAGQSAADVKEMMQSIREELKRTGKNSWLWLSKYALHVSTGWNNYTIAINDGYLRITACLRTSSWTKQKTMKQSSSIAKKVGDLTAMNTDVNFGPQSDFLQLSGQARLTLKSTCITGLLGMEAVYVMDFIVRFIVVTDNLKYYETFNSS